MQVRVRLLKMIQWRFRWRKVPTGAFVLVKILASIDGVSTKHHVTHLRSVAQLSKLDLHESSMEARVYCIEKGDYFYSV